MRLFEDTCDWVRVSCANPIVFELFSRHYSFRHWRKRNGVNGRRVSAPGEQLTLLTKCGKALFIWRKEKFRKDGQEGVNCAVFRNESSVLSSSLILQAENIAWSRWPGERLFTFVDGKKIKSSNPGYCFKRSGWKVCGITKAKKLIILEKYSKCSPAKNK